MVSLQVLTLTQCHTPRKLRVFLEVANRRTQLSEELGDVCGEWSKRYGDLVSGWWFDGYKMEMKIPMKA